MNGVHMNFAQFDLNLLRVFDAVMAERNLTRAAERLHMTQPAVSHALKRLRVALGQELFTRQAFGMRPTAQAERLWPDVRAALDAVRLALAPTDFDPQQGRHRFRIAMADATAALLLPRLMARLEAERAQVALQVVPLATRDPRHLLAEGEADMAIGYFPLAVAALHAGAEPAPVRVQRLAQSTYVCVMRRGHALAAEGALTLDAYCAARHLLVSFSGRPHGFVDEALAGLGRERNVVLTVNQFFTAGRVVAHSDLLTVLPLRFLPAAGYEDVLVARPLPLQLAPIHIDLLWHLQHDASAPQRWLRAQIEASAHAASAKARERPTQK